MERTKKTVAGSLGAVLAALLLTGPTPALAGIYGVPTNLAADGTTTGTTVNPPGWFGLDGIGSNFAGGEGVHQLRLLIEVTGSNLDIQIFDAGTSGARDLGGTAISTTYALYNPAGVLLATLTIGNDTAGLTENRLARLTPPCGAAPSSCGFFVPNNAAINNRDFRLLNGVTISPGLYELRITTLGAGGTETNALGVDIRDAEGSTTPYNAFTRASDNGATGAPVVTAVGETAWLTGVFNAGSPTGNVGGPITFFPFVDRGCTIQTSNFDMDLGGSGVGASASVTDTLGTATALTMSGATLHSENTVTVETVAATNLEGTNYGMYRMQNVLSTAASPLNAVDWRIADFQGSTSAGAAVPVQPTNNIRMYLPNSYAPAGGSANAVAPLSPVLLTSARVVSGQNPPVTAQVTRFSIATTFNNPTASAISNVQITVGHQANQASFSAPRGCINGAGVSGCDSVSLATCTDSSTGTYRRCTFTSVPANSVATMLFEVDYTPPGAGLRNLTGPPAALPNTTTSNATYTPTSSSLTFARTDTLGPLCNLVVNVGGGALATRAALAGLRVSPGRIEFATGSQRETVSFDVYATDDAQGRRDRTRLNAAPLRAPVPNSVTPILYRLDVMTAARFLMIEERDVRGRRHEMGPFATNDARLRRAFDRIESRLEEAGTSQTGRQRARLLSGRRAASLASRQDGRDAHRRGGAGRRRSTVEGVSVEVAAAGLVRIPLADLEASGLAVGNPRSLRVTNRGAAVRAQLVRGASGAPEAIQFIGETLSTDYTGTNVYVVSRGVPEAPVPLTISGSAPETGFTRVGRETLYIANAPEELDPWMWDVLFGDGTSWPYGWWDPTVGDFDLPTLKAGEAGSARLRLRFLGRTGHTHRIAASLNGVAVGSLTFQGMVSADLVGEIPLGALRVSGNQLSLQYGAGSGDDVGLAYLGHMDIQIPVAAADRPATFELESYDPSLPRAAGVSYLVIVHEDFLAQAERLAGLKAAEGQNVAVVDVARAYDRFSAGIVEANAVCALIQHYGRQSRRLRNVVLFGDDTFDARNYLGTGAEAFVPSLLAWDGEFGRVPSENRYADVDGDGRPDLSIGRLPAKSAAEAEILVDKIASQQAVLAGGRHLFAADNQAPGDIAFRAQAEAGASRLPSGSAITWADMSEDVTVARQRLLAALAGGASFVHYFGHAGPQVWADEGLLVGEDVSSLAGTGRGAVVFTWACEAQWFQYLFGETVNEALLLVPNGGAVATFGPAGISDPMLQRALYERVYINFFARRMTLGAAIRRAKAEALAADPALKPVVEGWNLLGDPSLRIGAGIDDPPVSLPGDGASNGGDSGRK